MDSLSVTLNLELIDCQQDSDIAALRKAIDAAKARIEEADEIIKKLEFTPVATNDPGLSNNGF